MNTTSPNRRVALGAALAVVLAFATGAVGSGTDDSAAIAKLKRQVSTLKLDVKTSRADVAFLK